jgi:nucleoside-diphosphate-sugar epimerase
LSLTFRHCRAVAGVSKLWGENLGRMYADEHGLSTLCVRMGHCGDAPTDDRDVAIFTSYRDVAQCLRLCVQAPSSLMYDCFYCISNNSRGYRDIEHTRKVLGYEPQDSADDFSFPRPK